MNLLSDYNVIISTTELIHYKNDFILYICINNMSIVVHMKMYFLFAVS